MNAKTLEAIRRHGNSLLAAFPNATEKDPVALCKKLRRIETSLQKPLVDYCNGENGMTMEKLDPICEKARNRAAALLGMSDGCQVVTGIHVNRDPRGYALKLDDEWVRNYRKNGASFYTDMGGYGILAPDLNQ